MTAPLLITPTCSIKILAHGHGIDKKNQVNNLKTFNILREGFFLRVDSEFIVEKEIFLMNVKTDKGIYLSQFRRYHQTFFSN